MSEMIMTRGVELRHVIKNVIESKTPAIMSYLSNRKWHVAKITITKLGANSLKAQIATSQKPRPINIHLEQPVGISLKHRYGKVIFDTKVAALEPCTENGLAGEIVLAIPDRIEIVERRNYFRVKVPSSLKVSVTMWHRIQNQKQTPDSWPYEFKRNVENQNAPEKYFQARLLDISAGGAQLILDEQLHSQFRKGQFITVRFTPMPYETPLVLNTQIRNILPTADGKNHCLGLQIVGLEASPDGHVLIQRLCNVVEQYYRINQANAKKQQTQEVEELIQAQL